MRKYTLASLADRPNVDLRDYEAVITEAVHTILPKAGVTVKKDCYYISGTLQHGDAIKIGRLICQSELKRYCVQVPKLFSSIELEEVTDNGTT